MYGTQSIQLTPDNIEQHIISKTKDSHICALCHKETKARTNIRQHIRLVHLKERKHRCQFCDATFTHKGNAKQHEKICKSRN